MRTSKLVAKILFVLCKVLAIFYLFLFIYSAFCMISGIRTEVSNDGNLMHILYPFIDANLMDVDNNLPYKIFSFLLPIGLYALFFYLASNIFKIFSQKKLFTKKNVKQLKWFYGYNLFIPLPVGIVSSFFVEVDEGVWMLVFVHFILGIFTYFLAQIFYQGLGLQDEQDLII